MTSKRRANLRGHGGLLRGELVDAASRLLEEGGGEEQLSLRAVTRAAGVAPQSFYRHFADKRALLGAVYRTRFEQLVEELTEAAAAVGPDPRARLREVCRSYCAYAERHPGHYRVLFGTAGTPGWEPDSMPGLAAFDVFRELVRACLTDDADAVSSTVCLWATLHGLVTLRRDRPSFPWPDRDTLIDDALDRLR
jgi:AcrR family transcriptional regulator